MPQNAESELAYQLQAAKTRQLIRAEEIEIDVVERRRQIEVEEQEVLRKEKELIANVNRPAEAEKFKVETIAQAQRCVPILDSRLWLMFAQHQRGGDRARRG